MWPAWGVRSRPPLTWETLVSLEGGRSFLSRAQRGFRFSRFGSDLRPFQAVRPPSLQTSDVSCVAVRCIA
jgi:hypothetical protein